MPNVRKLMIKFNEHSKSRDKSRGKSRRNTWQSAIKSVKTTAEVVKLLKPSVKSRQASQHLLN